jgi:hypothetical protein
VVVVGVDVVVVVVSVVVVVVVVMVLVVVVVVVVLEVVVGQRLSDIEPHDVEHWPCYRVGFCLDALGEGKITCTDSTHAANLALCSHSEEEAGRTKQSEQRGELTSHCGEMRYRN